MQLAKTSNQDRISKLNDLKIKASSIQERIYFEAELIKLELKLIEDRLNGSSLC